MSKPRLFYLIFPFVVVRHNSGKVHQVLFITASLTFCLSREHHFYSAERQVGTATAKLAVISPTAMWEGSDISEVIHSKLHLFSFSSLQWDEQDNTDHVCEVHLSDLGNTNNH